MMEHSSLRLRFRMMRETKDYDSIYEIEEFVRSCHAKIEDEIVFPKLRVVLSSEGFAEVTRALSRLEADHKLIDAIGEQIKLRTSSGELETLRKRISLYCTTVETHNTAEETLVFRHWKKLDSAGARESSSSARKIVEDFGSARYFQIIGISQELFEQLE